MQWNLLHAVSVALLLRLLLVLYGEWQDSHFRVRYTDIDYVVYSDAARYVASGLSPYERATYRYSPLLAYLLVPNSLFHPAWGKLLFVAADLLVGVLLYAILRIRLPEQLALPYASLYLFNPVAINVCTRGNADALAASAIVGSIYLLLIGKRDAAAIVHGFAVHFRIFPVFFSLVFVLYLHNPGKGCTGFLAKLPFSPRCLRFGMLSASTFFVLLVVGYLLHGYPFLHETYLYHLTRADNRHNFSVYFYHIYLALADFSGASMGLVARLAGFVPQLLLTLCISVKCYRDLPFAVLLLTWTFVIFNKVYTVQYFIWYLCLLPLVLPHCGRKLSFAPVLLWLGALSLWFYYAYRLEFEGEATFRFIWLAGLAFFTANVGCLLGLLFAYCPNKPPRPLWGKISRPRS